MQCPDLNRVPDLDKSPGYQLWLASNAWQRVLRRAIEPIGLTHVQFLALAAIKHLNIEGEVVTQRNVSRFAALDENMTSQVVRCLEGKGLVLREPHPSDARAQCLRLTPSGVELFLEAKAIMRPLLEKFFAPVADRAEELAAMLKSVADAQEV